MRKQIFVLSLAACFQAATAIADDIEMCNENYIAFEQCINAAEQGNAIAQRNMGTIYKVGLGVAVDNTKAMRWFRAAAKQGDARAQYSLGTGYDQGKGVVQNYIQAHMWFNISAANGYGRAAGERRYVAQIMTDEQIAEAQARAQRCLESNYSDC